MFQVYPDPPAAPLVVPAGTDGPLKPITERVGTDPASGLDMMVIRVAMLGAGSPPAPTIRLKADTGDAVAVPAFPDAATVLDRPGGGSAVANVIMDLETDEVFRVRVIVFSRGRDWKIQLVNNDPAAAHAFTWTVADNDAETRQPWIELPESLALETVVGATVSGTVQIANHGTGRLTVQDAAGFQPGPGFTLTTVPPTIRPNARGDLVVTFTGPAEPGKATAGYAVTCNDTTAQQAAGHNGRIALTADTHRLKPGTIVLTSHLDSTPDPDTGAFKYGLVAVNPASGEQRVVFSADITDHLGPVAVEANGMIVFGFGGAVVRADPVTGRLSRLAKDDLPGLITSLLVEPDGHILVARDSHESGDAAVVRLDPVTGEPFELASGIFLGNTSQIALEPGGDIIVANIGDFSGLLTLVRVDRDTGAQDSVATIEEQLNPVGAVVEADGAVLLAVQSFDRPGGVVRVDPRTGALTDVSREADLADPAGLAVEPGGAVVVSARPASGAAGAVFRLAPGTGTPAEVTAGGNLSGPLQIAVMPGGG